MKTARLMSIVAAVILPFLCLAQSGGGKLDMGELKLPRLPWLPPDDDRNKTLIAYKPSEGGGYYFGE